MRLQSDEKLIALVRTGNNAAFEALVQRYQPRLLAFCRHMLSSQEDAEDVLQEVFAASYNALLADNRPINARPWLYRIARNRSLNHLRKPKAAGQDSMDIFERDGGVTTADTAHKREEFRQIVSDVQELPESQRTALLLREIDALSYDQIAEAMETTIPSVKSLLVRARVGLAEAAEARLLTCEEVRCELGQVAEGMARTTPPVRRHLKSCERCRVFRTELRRTSRALAAIYPLGPLILLKQFGITKLGFGGGAAAGGAATAAGGSTLAGGASIAAGGAATAASAGAAGGAISAGIGTIASKAAAGMAAAAIVTAGAVEVKHVGERETPVAPPALAQTAPPRAAAPAPAATERPAPKVERAATYDAKPLPEPAPAPPVAPAVPVEPPVVPPPVEPPVQEEGGTATLPPRTEDPVTLPPTDPSTLPPGEPATTPEQAPPAPPAGEPAPMAGPPPPAPPSR